MRLDLLELDNYGSYQGHHELRLGELGLLYVRGDNRDEPKMNSNGAGKSSGTCEPLEWCLFGVVPKGDHADSIVNEIEGKNTRVAAHWSDGPGYKLMVERFRKQGGKKSGLRFWVDGEEKTTLDAAETQRLLELELGLDHQVFRAAVVFGQVDRFLFADATDKDRIDVCTKIFQLEDIDTWGAAAKVMRDETKPLVDGWQRELVQREARLSEHAALREKVQIQATNWDYQHTQELGSLERDRGHKEAALAAKLDDKQRAEAKLAEIPPAVRRPLASFLPPDCQAWEERQKQLEEEQALLMRESVPRPAQIDPMQMERQALEKQRSDLRGEWKLAASKSGERRSLAQKYRAMGVGKCRECGQDVTQEHLDREVARLESEAAVHEAEQAGIEALAKEIESQVAQVTARIVDLEQAYQQGIAQQQARVAACHGELVQVMNTIRGFQSAAQRAWQENEQLVGARALDEQRLVSLASEIGELQRGLTGVKAHLEGKRAEVNPFVVPDDDGSVARLEAAVAEARGHVEQGQWRLGLIQFWIDACGPDGIKSYVMDTRLHELTQAANEGVLAMTGGTHWVQLDTVTAGRTTKTVRNKINIRVFKYDTTGGVIERGYRSYSGGERQRVSLGIDFGLAGLIARRSRKQYAVLFLDELFRHVDRAGKEAVVDMLGQLRQTKRTVVAIEHDDEFRQHFDRELLVIKEGGRSRFVLEDTDGRCDQVQAGAEAK